MKGIRAGSFLHNLSFVFGAQMLVLIISVARAFILPKFLSVEGFGYWEIYWFYTSYVGIFCLGYNDGIYLKYGECNVEQLPMDQIRSGNRLYTAFLSIATVFALFFISKTVQDKQAAFSLYFAALNIFTLGLTSLFIYVFQITAQFKKYSIYSVLDKIAVLVTILLLVIVNEKNFRYVVIADCLFKFVVLVLMVQKMPGMLFGSYTGNRSAFYFLIENMGVGIKLMIANLMSMLLIGAGKFIVQYFGDITDFAMYSFGVSITGLVLTAVTAIGLVLYPTIKRIPQSSHAQVFHKVNVSTRVLGLASLLIYFPMYYFVEWFYPQYISVLSYLYLLFLIVYFQCKISLLNNTFYKVLRLETKMLVANLSCVLLFIILALVLYPHFLQMKTIALCTMVAMLFRCYASEISLSKSLEIKVDKRIVLELSLVLLFFVLCEYLTVWIAAIIFTVTIVGWMLCDDQNRVVIDLLISSKKSNP